MKWVTTSKFSCQSWTVSLLSLLGCLIGLVQVSIGSWLWIFSDGFALLLGELLRAAFIGYILIGAAAFLTCIFGVASALLRNRCGLILCGTFSLASIVCQASMWTYIFLEQMRVSGNLKQTIQLRQEYYDFLASEFNCNLEPQASMQVVESCASFVNEWLSSIVWAMFGICLTLIFLQLCLLIMAAMLYQLISEDLRRTASTVPGVDGVSLNTRPSEQDRSLSHDMDQSDSIPEPSGSQVAPRPPTPVADSRHTNTSVNVNTKVTANITVNAADVQRMGSTSPSECQPPLGPLSDNEPYSDPLSGYEPSPGLPWPVTANDPRPSAPPPEQVVPPPYNPEWPPTLKPKINVGI